MGFRKYCVKKSLVFNSKFCNMENCLTASEPNIFEIDNNVYNAKKFSKIQFTV